ncbi:MAG: c-type cytochrome biogenesis protein CcmI [Alphaproteobacteria bacterium]|nr:c-type cytochrome biogenesis protein CcmI [Rhodospirillales bacterium]MCW9046257.1 c-type cytochrome biogenesis protein CcmI [Alphaproteobacteria bacterium]
MITFWIAGALISFAVAVVLVFPLLRGPKEYLPRGEYDAKVYDHQLIEVENDIQRGLITEEETESARIEIQRRLLATPRVGENVQGAEFGNGLRWTVTTLSVLIVSLGSMVIYWQLGAPGLPDTPYASRGDELERVEQSQQIVRMVERLSARLKENPKDAKGWGMLGRSFRVLDRLEESAQAYAKAYELDSKNLDLALDYGEVLVFIEQGYVTPKARSLFETVLAKDTKNFMARFYLGMAFAETTSELPKAIALWEGLVADSPEGSPWLPSLKEHLRQARKATVKSKS